MADDVVIAKFTADLGDLQAKFDTYIKSLEKLDGKIEDVGDTSKTTSKTIVRSLKEEEAELNKIGKSVDKAFDSKKVNEFNKSLKESKTRVTDIRAEAQKTSSGIKSSFAGVASGIAAAFSITAIIGFAKASFDAFVEAEKQANALKFAVTGIGQEGEIAFNRLIEQATKLQDVGIFSTGDIQRAQTALITFGLTADQVELLIPKVLDLASATGKTLPEATSTLIQGLSGSVRALRPLGIEMENTGSKSKNLANLLEELEKFEGSTGDAAETTAGKLERLGNTMESVKETTGALIVDFGDSFVKALEDAGKDIEKFINKLGFFRVIPKEIEQMSTSFDALTKSVTEQLISAENLAEFDEIAAKLRRDQIDSINEQEDAIDNLQDKIDIAANREKVNQKELNALQTASTKLKETNLANEEEKLRIIDAIIEANRRSRLDDKITDEATDKRIAGSDKEAQTIERLTGQYKDLLTLLTDIDRKKIIELKIAASVTDPLTGETQVDIEKFRTAVAELVAKNPVEIPVTLEIPPEREVKESGKKAGEAFKEGFSEETLETLDVALSLLGELNNLYDTFTNAQLDRINTEKEARLNSIDEQLNANEDALKKNRISEQQAANNEKRLLDEKIKAEETAAKKEREIKRKQAILDKAAALIDITIQTARNIVASKGNPVLIALNAALGAAQAAIVASQPIPYKKGTKGAKGGLSLVGEEGPEMTVLPQGTKVIPAKQTKKYSKVFDAMVDDQFESYIFKTYITPELDKRRRTFEDNKQESFAKNIASSIQYNNTYGVDPESISRTLRKGSPMTNVDELADAIASRIKTNIYRR